MSNAIAYIRVSSRTQDYTMQRVAIEHWAAARGDSVSDWRSEKRSARTMDRPELLRLMAETKAGLLRGRRLYVFRLDRLTRTGIKDTLQAVEDLRDGGVEIVSIHDGIDLVGPHADIIIATMAWASQMERLATNERIAAARERVEREGGTWGRQPRMSAEDVEKAKCMHMSGRSTRKIAMALKIPRSTIAAALRRGMTAGQASKKDRAERAAREQLLRASESGVNLKGTSRSAETDVPGASEPPTPPPPGTALCAECKTTDLRKHAPMCELDLLASIFSRHAEMLKSAELAAVEFSAEHPRGRVVG